MKQLLFVILFLALPPSLLPTLTVECSKSYALHLLTRMGPALSIYHHASCDGN